MNRDMESLKESGNLEFTPDQKKEIEEGIAAGVDTSIYARPEFLAIQMRQLKLGLMDGIDVTIYADPAYDWFQMEQIRRGLKYGLDVSRYASPRIPYDKMRQIRKGLSQNMDLSPYLEFDAGILRELRKARADGIQIRAYITEGYDAEQLEQIRIALKNGVDIKPYLKPEYSAGSLAEIREGLENGLDVSVYAKTCYSWRQMREIRMGLEQRVDIAIYANPLYSYQQMEEIRLGLESGIPVNGYRSMMYAATDMHNKRIKLLQDMKELEKIAQTVVPGFAPGTVEEGVKEAFRIVFSPDDMEVYLVIEDPEKVFTEEEILQALWNNKVRKGIQRKEISRIVDGTNEEPSVLVASGQPPRPGKDGWYEYFFRVNVNRKPKVLEDGSVDYQNIEWFETVKAGDKLAFYHPAEDGVDGYTVKGKVLPAIKGREQGILLGFGFVLEPDQRTYISAVDGWADQHDNKLEISSMLVIDEDTTLATGNIVFNGSVHVKGSVGSQTEIKAEGDVLVDGFVEAASIEAGGNVVLRQGMNGTGNGRVKAGGDVMGRFFEAVQVYAGGNIQANYCLNCDLYAENTIEITRANGTMVGGTAYAERGIIAQNVGNRVGMATYLRVGLDQKNLDELHKLNENIRNVSEELRIIENARTDFNNKYPLEVRSNMDVYAKIENAVYTKEKQLEELNREKAQMEERIQSISDAKVVVNGRLYEGTIIEINGMRWNSRQAMNVTIRKTVDETIAVYRN